MTLRMSQHSAPLVSSWSRLRTALLAMPIGLALCSATFVLECFVFREFTAEDAYIVLRYARNAASFGELAFNLGERVSALTSPLHALTEVLLFKTLGTGLVPYKWLGLGLTLGTLLFCLYKHRERPTVQLVVALVFATPWMALWTMGGLETPLLTALLGVLATLVTSQTAARSTRRDMVLIHMLAGLAFLTRFDSILFTGPILVATWLLARDRRAVLLSLLAGALIPVCWLVFAKLHYDALLPTSFHVKRPVWTLHLIARNAIYVSGFAVLTLLAPFVWVRSSDVLKRWCGLGPSQRTLLTGLLLGLLLESAYGLSTATTHMMFGGRLLIPYLLPAGIAVGVLFADSRLLYRVRTNVLLVIVPGLIFHGVHTNYVHAKSLNGFLPVGEYRSEGAASYANTFLPVLLRNGSAIEKDWSQLGVRRPPRVFTFAGGVLPYNFADMYVVENLVSYPWFAAYELEHILHCVDYVHILTPRHGSTASQLGRGADRMRLVSRETFVFDGVPENFEVYAAHGGSTPGATMSDCMALTGQAR